MEGLTVGQLASATGVTPDAVRYYERLNLIGRAPRSDNGYRRFPDGDVERIRMIRRVQALGLSLAEIGALLSQMLSVVPKQGCRAMRDALSSKMHLVDRRIADLQHVRCTLAEQLAACERALSSSRRDVRCPVLTARTEAEPRRARA